MSSPSQDGVIFVKMPEERQSSYHDWISSENSHNYHRLSLSSENLPSHTTPIRVPNGGTYQSMADCGYGKLTFHRYRFSSPYSPYNSFVSPMKAKQTYGRKGRSRKNSFFCVNYLKNKEKSEIIFEFNLKRIKRNIKDASNMTDSCFSSKLSPARNLFSETTSDDTQYSSSFKKSNSDVNNVGSQKVFTLCTPKQDNLDDSDMFSETMTNYLDRSDTPKSINLSSSPDFSASWEKQNIDENKTIEKSRFTLGDTKMSLFKDNTRNKTVEKESHVRILDIKSWYTGKFLEDSTNMQLMISKKGFALQKNGEMLPYHNYNANEIRNIAYEFDQYGLLYIRLKNRNAKLNGPGTEYLIQIVTTQKLRSLRILQYSCPEVDLIELTPEQAQKMLSLKKLVNPFKKNTLSPSDDLINSNEINTNASEISPYFCRKLDESVPRVNSKSLCLSKKDEKTNEKNEPRLIYPPVVLYDDDIERLNDGEFLNDTIIDFYLKYIQNKLFQNDPSKIEKSHIFNTFFYKKLVDKDRSGKKGGYQNVKKWTSKTKIDVFSKKYVVVPVNESLHWYVVIICNLDTIPDKHLQNSQESIESNTRNEMFSFFSPKKEMLTNLSFYQNDKKYNISNSFSDSQEDELIEEKDKHRDTGIDRQEIGFKSFFGNSQLSRLSRDISTSKKHNQEKSIEKSHTQLSKKSNIPIRKPVIIIFDSLGGQHNITLRNLRDYLYEEAKDKLGLELNKADIAGIHANVPQQSNHCDCGLFLLHYVEQFLNDPDRVLPLILNHHNKTSISSDIKNLWGQEKISSFRNELRLLIKHLQNESLIIPKNNTDNTYLNQKDIIDDDSDELIMYF
ncbi:hypothetical protein T552_00964 [Pneumocystis carinii B80]|uniref:Ubiquitin-like protease family profile domain-containing protein n=1 Tax=Pneumocystis carinii (strain B80) TaxID=1408658 RepID=A0A0W4ZN09_PNEC8|nr:hypothetical protein T552_00964 [Pneumocystis carinii B80]KTW29757.1 hypothetical protein T552_00964 [Pneumocystis carinii B80]